MAHELDVTNGIASFANSRTDAWHRLGQSVGHVMTAMEALDAAHLSGWNVRKMPMVVPVDDRGGDATVPVTNKWATMRTNPITGATEYLGVVGSGFTVIQNENSVAFLDALIDESGANVETAGALRSGREVFVTMKLPMSMTLTTPTGNQDVTDFYLAAMNSHDGNGPFRVRITPVRVVCANTWNAAVRRSVSTWSIRHTTNALKSIEEARQSLGVAFAYISEFQDEADAMMAAAADEDFARRTLTDIFKVDDADTEKAENRRLAHVGRTLELFTSSPTLNGTGGTRFGLYNAVTEYVDHLWPTAGEAIGVAPESQLIGPYADLKARAFSKLLVTA
jgi:phage/plasmid-like protein (TIGR03299 family)